MIHEYQPAGRGSTTGKTDCGWRGTSASFPLPFFQEKTGPGLRRGGAVRWAFVLFDARAAVAVVGRWGDRPLAVHGPGLAMDLAARPGHGGDPRPQRFPVLGARGGGRGHVGNSAAKPASD